MSLRIEYTDAESLELDRHLYSNFLSSRSGSQHPRKATVFFKEPLVQHGKFALCGIDHETKDGIKRVLSIECRCDSGKACIICSEPKKKRAKPLLFSYSSWRRFLKQHKNKETIVNPKKRAASVDLDDIHSSSSSLSLTEDPNGVEKEKEIEREKRQDDDDESRFFSYEDWMRFMNEHDIGRVDMNSLEVD
jgi:hypothetical protein